MVLNRLKQIRSELVDSTERYDNAFKKVALIAAEELVKEENRIKQVEHNLPALASSTSSLDKKYFLNKYGSLKKAKAAYTRKYGKQKYGRSWSDFITIAKKLDLAEQPVLSLEDRIIKIEKFLVTLGYQP